MNTDPIPTEQQRVIAAAAADYTPPEPQSHTMLAPHRESIAMLRSKGASYRTIVKILDKVNIRVSLDTLSRFCRDTIEQKPVGKGRRRPMPPSSPAPMDGSAPEPAPPQRTPDNRPAARDAKPAEPVDPPRGKGPRIADPTSI